MPTLNFFAAVSKTAVITLYMQYVDVHLELFQCHLKLHPDQLKRVWENEANRFCFALTPSQDNRHWKWRKMVAVNGA